MRLFLIAAACWVLTLAALHLADPADCPRGSITAAGIARCR